MSPRRLGACPNNKIFNGHRAFWGRYGDLYVLLMVFGV